MIIECIATGIAGVFLGGLLASWGVDSMINEHKERLREIRKELNSHKKAKDFHIGQVVYACKYNSFYMGEITEIFYKKDRTIIKLTGEDEYFDLKMIYTNKDEALQQIKI